jgi:hypothetical protein
MKRTISQEKIWVNKKTNFHYIVRGVERVPKGSEVYVSMCGGTMTAKGYLKGTENYVLTNHPKGGQCVAWSKDLDDLYLFAAEHAWFIDDNKFRELTDQ